MQMEFEPTPEDTNDKILPENTNRLINSDWYTTVSRLANSQKVFDLASFKPGAMAFPTDAIYFEPSKHLTEIMAIKSPILDYIAKEETTAKSIREAYNKLYEPTEALIDRQKQIDESIAQTERMWRDLNAHRVVDGMFTIPSFTIEQLYTPAKITSWVSQ